MMPFFIPTPQYNGKVAKVTVTKTTSVILFTKNCIFFYLDNQRRVFYAADLQQTLYSHPYCFFLRNATLSTLTVFL